MNKKNYFLLFLFFLGSFLVRAQSITVATADMPSSVVACGDPATFKVNVFGPLASGSTITLTLPTGAKFNSLVSGNVTATATATGATFKLNAALATASDKVTIEYTVDTACGTVASGAQLTYATGSVSKTVDYPTINSSLLEVTTVTPSSATIAVNATQNYTVTVKQSSTTAYSNNVKINVKHSTKVKITTTSIGTITYGTPSAGSQTDVIELTGAQIAAIGDGDTKFENGETIAAVITAKLLTCTSGETLNFQAAYGCGTYTACATGNVTNAGLAQTATGTPSFEGLITKHAYPGWFGQPDTGTFKLKNTGTGDMYNVEFDLYNNYTANSKLNFAYLIFSNVNVNGNSIANSTSLANRYYYKMNFTSDPDGPGVGLADLDDDGLFDDLPAGQSFNLGFTLTFNKDASANLYTDCDPLSGTNLTQARGYMLWDNACGVRTESYNIGPANFWNISLSGYSDPLNSEVSKNDGSAPNLVANDPFRFIVVTGNIYDSYERTKNIGASQAFWRMTLRNVPAGIIPNGNGTLASSGGKQWIYNAGLSNPANGTLVYDIDYELINDKTTTLPLMVSSSCNSNGSYTFDYDFTLYQDPANKIRTVFCNTTPTFTLNCGTVPGIQISDFKFKRTDLGYTDYTLTTKYTEATAPATLRRTRFMPADEALASFKTVVNNVVTAPKFVVEYDASLTKLGKDKVYDFFEQRNADTTENAGSGFISGIFNIQRGATVYTFNVNNSYHTYTQNNGATEPKTLHTFDIEAIINAMKTAGTLPASFTLQVGDQLNFDAKFKVAEGVMTGSPDNSENRTLSNFKAYVTSTLTGSPIKSNEYAELPLICLARSSAYREVAGYDGFSDSVPLIYSTVGTDGCNESYLFFYNYLLMRDLSNTNFFPNEYRPFAKYKTLYTIIPSGFEVTRAEHRAFSADFPNQNITANMVVKRGYNIDGTPNPTGGYNLIELTDDGTWYSETGGKSVMYPMIYLFFRPKPIVATQLLASGAQYKYNVLNSTTTDIFMNNAVSKRVIPANPPVAFITTALNSPINYIKTSISSSASSVTTATDTAQWDINVTNTSTNNIIAKNVWVAIDTNNNIVPTLWDGATQIPLTSYATGKYYAVVGDIAFNSTKNLTIKSNNFTVCGTDNFTVRQGWDCNYTPVANSGKLVYAQYNNEEAYTVGSLTYGLTTQNPSIAATSSVNASGNYNVDICTSIPETLTVTNGANGYAYKIYPNITFPVGMSFVSGSFKVNYNGTDYAMSDPTLVSGTTYKADIYSAAGLPFATTGLPGTSQSTNPTSFVLKYSVSTSCSSTGSGNYVSGSRIGYEVNAQSGCQYQLPLVDGQTKLRSQPVVLNGAPTGKAYTNSLKSFETPDTTANLHIDGQESLRVTVVNQGDTTGAFESVKIFVDDAYDYVAGSYTLTSGNDFALMPPVNEPTSTADASGQRTIEWTIPAGFTIGKTIQFDFKLKVVDPASLACSDTKIATMNTYVRGTTTCASSGTTCNLEFPTGPTQELTLKAFKPTITVISLANSYSTVSGNTNYSIQYKITNTDTVYEVKPQLNIKIYNDANKNGVYDSGETLVGTNHTTGTVNANSTLTETITGTMTGTPSNIVVVFESNNTVSDICSSVSFALTSYCFKPGAMTGGTVLDTPHGITALGRAGTTDADQWPMVRKGAWTVLEAKTKGFVINRIATTSAVNSIANPVEGMMVYDEEADCLKIYVIDTTVPANTGWKCFNTQACPD